MPALSPKVFVKSDLVEWIKAFDEDDGSAYQTIGAGDIKFAFIKHDTDELAVKLFDATSKADFKKLPDLVQKKVANLESAASMLYHELCYEANTGKRHTMSGKRHLLYDALRDLLSPQNFTSGIMTEKERSASKMWIMDNVIAVLLKPSSAPQSMSERLTTTSLGKATKELAESAGSLISSLFRNRTSSPGVPSTQMEVAAHQEHPEVPSLASSASTTPDSKQPSFSFTRYSGSKDLPPGDPQPLEQFTPAGSLPLTGSSIQTTPPQSKLKQE
jgi:hypothetical protein